MPLQSRLTDARFAEPTLANHRFAFETSFIYHRPQHGIGQGHPLP